MGSAEAARVTDDRKLNKFILRRGALRFSVGGQVKSLKSRHTFNKLIVCVFRSVRVQLIARATFTKDLEGVADDGTTSVSRINAYFHSRSTIVNESQLLDIDALISYFNKRVEEFNRKGSGYILASIDRLTLSFVKYRPLGGSSYIPTPAWLRSKHCVVNVQKKDARCFVWAVLSALYPAERQSYRTSH